VLQDAVVAVVLCGLANDEAAGVLQSHAPCSSGALAAYSQIGTAISAHALLDSAAANPVFHHLTFTI
jgi:hypothetical protein